jgi:hypothetical protein
MKPPITNVLVKGVTVNKRDINNTVAFTVKHYTDVSSLTWNENLIFFKLQYCRLFHSCFLHISHPNLPRTHHDTLTHTKGIQNTYITKNMQTLHML